MSIDYYSCKHCGDSFPDVVDYVCCECGECWCSEECAETDGYIGESCKLGKEQCDGYPEEECEFAYRRKM